MDAQWALLAILGRIGFFVSLKKLLPAAMVTIGNGAAITG